MKKSLFLISAAACAMMMACSSDDNGSVTSSKGTAEASSSSKKDVITVDSLDDLPNCTSKREGKVAYVEEEKNEFVCEDGEWVEYEEDAPASSSDKNASSSSKRSSVLDDDDEEGGIDDEGDASEEDDVKSSSSKRSSSSVTSDPQKSEETKEYIYDAAKGTLYDKRDEETYNTVIIGDRVWTAENNRFATGREILEDGCSAMTSIQEVDCSESYDSKSCGATDETCVCFVRVDSDDHCARQSGERAPGGDDENIATLGRLYSWLAAKISCPTGWHVPTYGDWESLFAAAGMDDVFAASSCGLCSSGSCNSILQKNPRENSTCNYDPLLSEDFYGSDDLKISFVLAGIYYGGIDQSYYDYGVDAAYWSSTGRSLQRESGDFCNPSEAYGDSSEEAQNVDAFGFRFYAKGAGTCYDFKAAFFPTRCVKD